MSADRSPGHDGGCACRQVRFRLQTGPMVVHACHCRWCQRETGTAFALNAMIEADRVSVIAGAPELIDTPSESGLGQRIARCPRCHVALWSHYAGAGPLTCLVRVGTLDEPDCFAPDVHIFTASKQPWVVLAPGAPAFAEYYDDAERERVWPAQGIERRRVLLPKIEAYRAARAAA